ncbi:MAG: GTPase ObgE, partial [Patescibacteria group bacterium]|nr:GTPase ObgE [Patescibacteria group bacterium]
MAFVDEVTIRAAAGKGGDGVVRWLHLRGNEKGGPSGGDGGRGGDVVLAGVRDLAALSRYRAEKDFRAEDGGAGAGDLKRGANGEPLTLLVPVGTLARVEENGTEYEILEEGARVTIFKGGSGGKGNARFKSSTNQNPFEHTDGKPGQAGDIHLSLKLIADAGLIGLPSAGKSSLLNALTRAAAKVGDYPFTTLEPNLGDYHGYILADIPGLIAGAAEGRGLGTKFLKHIERTKLLIHLVSADQADLAAAYREVRREIEAVGGGLAEKSEILVLAKADLLPEGERESRAAELARAAGREVLLASAEDPEIL